MLLYVKKVMRLSVVLFWIFIVFVFLIVFNILNWLFWEILDNNIFIVSSVIIILFVVVFMFVIVLVYWYKYCRYVFEKYYLCVWNGILFLDEKVILYFCI